MLIYLITIHSVSNDNKLTPALFVAIIALLAKSQKKILLLLVRLEFFALLNFTLVGLITYNFQSPITYVFAFIICRVIEAAVGISILVSRARKNSLILVGG